jgi:hypothetical protein
MDPELNAYYDEMFALFASPGWKYLLEDLDRLIEPMHNVRAIKDTEALRFIQGQMDVADWLRDAKTRYEGAYTMLQEQK